METNERYKYLVGSWNAVITALVQGVTFPGLLSFTSDGIVLAEEPPGPFESTGHGNWIGTGLSDAAYTFFFLVGSSEGKLTALAKVTGAVHYDANTDTWNGPFKIWVSDAEGNPTLSDNGTVMSTRIAVQLLD